MKLDEDGYRLALRGGRLRPVGVFMPFINIDRVKYHNLQKDHDRYDFPRALEALQKRLGSTTYGRVRGAANLSVKSSAGCFPAYKFLVSEFLNEEWLSTVDWHKFHRDHVMHQPMAVYVGLCLLNGKDLSGRSNETLMLNGRTLLENCVENILYNPKCSYLKDYAVNMGVAPDHPSLRDRNMWEWRFLDAFFLAALYHDIGYPWKFVNIIHDKLDSHAQFDNPSGMGAKWLAERYGNRMVFLPFHGYVFPDRSTPADWPDNLAGLIRKGLTKTHGLPGAISLLHLNDLLRKYPDDVRDRPMNRFCLEWAAMAVMMHDLDGLYWGEKETKGKVVAPQLRVSFERDPLSFVLALTDQLQDFGRPDAMFSNDGPHSSRVNYTPRCSGVSVSLDDGTLKVKYSFNSSYDRALYLADFKPGSEARFFDPGKGYINFSGTGISRIALDADVG